jgi:predicted phage terminase large subunit-like protein
VRAWDLAASKKEKKQSDYTAGVKMAKDAEGRYFVLDVQHDRLLPDMRNKLMRQTAELDGRRVRVRLTQDPGQAGVDQIENLTKLLAGFSVTSERPTGPKETRADPLAAQVNIGNVKLLRGSWNHAFIEELRQFPLGAHDDQVDAAADAFNELAMAREVPSVPSVSYRG